MSRRSNYISSTLNFVFTVLIILAVRWALFEPYVIPSGSMIPGLLVNDHIVVKKMSYGLRYPFTENWIYGPKLPRRGEIVVFQHPHKEYIMVKRVIGLPGDKVSLQKNGQLKINGKEVGFAPISPTDEPFYPVTEADLQTDPNDIELFKHQFGDNKFRTILRRGIGREIQDYEVPQGHLFMMGDNRDNSSDSRFWGTLPVKYILGEASFVWLSCEETLESLPALCNPATIRWSRFFHGL